MLRGIQLGNAINFKSFYDNAAAYPICKDGVFSSKELKKDVFLKCDTSKNSLKSLSFKGAFVQNEEQKKIFEERVAQITAINLDEFDFSNPNNFINTRTSKEFYRNYQIADALILAIQDKEKSEGSISVNEVKNILKSAICPQSNIQKIEDSLGRIKIVKVVRDNACIIENMDDYYAAGHGRYVKRAVQYNNNFITNILKIIDSTTQAETESTSQYLERVVAIHREASKKKEEDFALEIKSRLTYVDDDVLDDEIILTQDEKKDLADKLNFFSDEFSADSDMRDLAIAWKKQYVDSGLVYISPRAERAILEQFPRYNSSEPHPDTEKPWNKDVFDISPLYRWLRMPDDENEFFKQFQDTGCEYSRKWLQSCSKCKSCGEPGNDGFSDSSKHCEIKFVIHPKGHVSKACDIGPGDHGEYEAIYPADTKFRYMGKINVECEDFNRWEIHLQEM